MLPFILITFIFIKLELFGLVLVGIIIIFKHVTETDGIFSPTVTLQIFASVLKMSQDLGID